MENPKEQGTLAQKLPNLNRDDSKGVRDVQCRRDWDRWHSFCRLLWKGVVLKDLGTKRNIQVLECTEIFYH
jgi:hypothetical protein